MRPRQLAKVLLSIALAAGPVRAAEVPHLLADINRTPQSELFPNLPSCFATAGGRLLFWTVPNFSGDDDGILWQTDGTASGTRVFSSSICPFACSGQSFLTLSGL